MIIAPYDKERNYDIIIESIVKKGITSILADKDDDFLMIAVGSTGTGKSMLMLHLFELFDSENCGVDYIGLDRGDFANALYKAKNKPNLRFCGNDEANISKRDSLTKYNKDTIDLYYSIRGLNIFHWWSNPSLDIIDKEFIEERIKGVIYIFTKSINKPRLYYHFTKKSLLKIWDKEKNLRLRTLKKYAKTAAYHRGWFRNYSGKLFGPYDKMKTARMGDKVDLFRDTYGTVDNYYTPTQLADKLGVHYQTLKRYKNLILEKNLLTDEEYKVTPVGKEFFHEKTISKFEKLMRSKGK